MMARAKGLIKGSSGMDLGNSQVVQMAKGFAIVVLMASFASGCTSLHEEQQVNAQQRYQALLWQQAEQIQKQRQSILQLQQQREQMQKQLVQLTVAVNNNMPASPAPADSSSAQPTPPDQPIKRVQVDETGKIILGQIEWAWFDLFGESVKARIDTGAKSSILYATSTQIFERDGESWLRFSVSSDWSASNGAEVRTFEAPLVRKVKIRLSGDGPSTRRPVVRLTTKVGTIVEDIEFVVHDKPNGAYPVVLGRSFIRDIAVVDVAQKYTQMKHTRASRL